MLNETKVYSDFIKRNPCITVKRDDLVFTVDGRTFSELIQRDDDGMWYIGCDDKSYTKKAAIYYYVVNRCIVVNGLIVSLSKD